MAWFQKKQILYIVALSLFWTLFLCWRGSPALTLQYKWLDHLSNLSVTRIFLQEGSKVFSVPKGQMVKPWPSDQPIPLQFKDANPYESYTLNDQKPLFLSWPELPSPYPPGVFLVFYPFSWIAYDLNLGYFPATFLFAFVFLILAHIVFFIFFQRFKELENSLITKTHKFFYYLVLFLVYCELCRWPMNGQYETFILPMMVGAFLLAERKKYSEAIFLVGLSLFFHPRALYFVPMVLIWFYQWIKSKDKKIVKDVFLYVGASLGAFSLAYVLYLSVSAHNSPDMFRGLNRWGLSALVSKKQWGSLLFLVSSAAVVSYFLIKNKFYHLAVSFIWIHLLLFQSAQVREWYVTPLIVLFFAEKPSFRFLKFAALAYFAIAHFYPNNSPLEFLFVKSVVSSLWDPGLRSW